MNVKKAGLIVAGVLTALIVASPVAMATEQPHGASCSFAGGDAAAASEISGDSLANAVAQAPVGGNNALNAGNCSSFLNGNLNGNLSGNDVDVLGGLSDLLP